MNTKQIRTLMTAAAVLALFVTPIAASVQEFKADVPKSITTPDVVEIRIGTLRFKDGLPDDETARKVYDSLDFARGIEAFISGSSYESVDRPFEPGGTRHSVARESGSQPPSDRGPR